MYEFTMENPNDYDVSIIFNCGGSNADIYFDNISLIEIPPTNINIDESKVPTQYKLYQNFPNPFNPETFIKFDLPNSCRVKIIVYNVLGQHIKTLMNTKILAGSHKVVWDGTDNFSIPVSSGIYIYRIETTKFISVKKMVLIP